MILLIIVNQKEHESLRNCSFYQIFADIIREQTLVSSFSEILFFLLIGNWIGDKRALSTPIDDLSH